MHNFQNLLDSDEVTPFGEVNSQEVERRTVVAVIYDPISQKYLCQYWPDYHGLTCLLSGGVEKSENVQETLLREIAEETGFTDFKVLGRLGGDILTHYYKQKSDQYFVKHITAYFIRLNSLQSQPMQKEDDEQFDNVFESAEKILNMMQAYETVTGSTIQDHQAILKRGMAYIQAINKEAP